MSGFKLLQCGLQACLLVIGFALISEADEVRIVALSFVRLRLALRGIEWLAFFKLVKVACVDIAGQLWRIGCLSVSQGFPVDAGEEWVRFYLLYPTRPRSKAVVLVAD
jgi:hypothetical protein